MCHGISLSQVCITSAALGAGLTMGTVSLETLDLKVKQRCGTEDEKRHATALLPLKEREPHHLLLVTLLLYNSIANEALPLFLDALVPGWAAIVLSVSLVLFFGELSTVTPEDPDVSGSGLG